MQRPANTQSELQCTPAVKKHALHGSFDDTKDKVTVKHFVLNKINNFIYKEKSSSNRNIPQR